MSTTLTIPADVIPDVREGLYGLLGSAADRIGGDLVHPDRDATVDRVRRGPRPRPLSNSSKNRIVVLHGVFARACKVCGLPVHPVSAVERHPVRLAGDIACSAPRRCGRSFEQLHPSRIGRST
jgi:hypothetical protein